MATVTAVGLFPPNLDAGSSGAAVKYLQRKLGELGFAVPGLIADGEYTKGPDGFTVRSVKRLQRALGFRAAQDVDGNFGPKTRARCKARGIFDFDAVPLDAAEGDSHTTRWVRPNSPNLEIWPLTHVEDAVEETA